MTDETFARSLPNLRNIIRKLMRFQRFQYMEQRLLKQFEKKYFISHILSLPLMKCNTKKNNNHLKMSLDLKINF